MALALDHFVAIGFYEALRFGQVELHEEERNLIAQKQVGAASVFCFRLSCRFTTGNEEMTPTKNSWMVSFKGIPRFIPNILGHFLPIGPASCLSLRGSP